MAEDRSLTNPYLNTLRPGRGRAPGLSRAVGNRVYRTNPVTGNLELASSELEPTRPPADSVSGSGNTRTTQGQGGLENIFAMDIPQPSLARTLGNIAGSAVATEGIKRGGKKIADAAGRVGGAISDTLATRLAPAGRLPANKVIPGFGSPDEPSRLADQLRAEALGDTGDFAGEAFDFGGFGSGADFVGDIPVDPAAGAAAGGIPLGVGTGIAAGVQDVAAYPETNAATFATTGMTGFGGVAEGASEGGISGAISSIPVIGPIFSGLTGGGGCYITEAVTAAGGADNAPELETLRWFRDNVLTLTPQGQELIGEYEQAAPAIAQTLLQRPDGEQILNGIMESYIRPAVEAVRAGQFDEALRIYAEMNTMAAELAVEVTEDPQIERLLEEFAQEAAEVAHDSELGSLATATGNQLVHPGDQVADQPHSRLGRIFVGG